MGRDTTPTPATKKKYEVFEERAILAQLDGAGHDLTEIEVLIPVGTFEASDQEDACWIAVESDDALKARAVTNEPPKLRAGNAARGGLSPAKGYKLATTTKRVTT